MHIVHPLNYGLCWGPDFSKPGKHPGGDPILRQFAFKDASKAGSVVSQDFTLDRWRLERFFLRCCMTVSDEICVGLHA